MYSEKVMDHFENPRNVGEIENASGVGTVGNAKCGDIMRIYLDIDEDGIIQDCKFKTFGCGAAVATSSMATELVKGKSIQDAMKVTNKAVMEALDGLPPVKVHCSLLAEEAIHAALWDYAEKVLPLPTACRALLYTQQARQAPAHQQLPENRTNHDQTHCHNPSCCLSAVLISHPGTFPSGSQTWASLP